MSTTARTKNRRFGLKKGHRREPGRTPAPKIRRKRETSRH